MATGKFFREVQLPEQKSYGLDVVRFPVVLSPITTNDTACNVFEEAIRSEKPWLESLLQKNGVILFRGFPVMSPSDFNNVVEAFGFREFSYVGGRAPRNQITGRVYTANDIPLHVKIPFHHELAYNQDFPSKLFLYCDEEPEKGGETPVVLSHMIYEEMKKRHPKLVAKLEEHGVTYITITGDEDDPPPIGGKGWKSIYMTHHKSIAEERAAKQGSKLEWTEKGVKITSARIPAIRFDTGTQRKTWFFNHGFGPVKSNVEDHYQSYFELGNGEYVPNEHIKDCLKVMEEECVAIPWKRGDVLGRPFLSLFFSLQVEPGVSLETVPLSPDRRKGCVHTPPQTLLQWDYTGLLLLFFSWPVPAAKAASPHTGLPLQVNFESMELSS